MERKEARIVAEDPPPTNNGVPEEPPARQDVDVLLDVSELEVDKIHLKVRNLRVHVPPKACRPQSRTGGRTRQAILALQPFSLAYSAERVEGCLLGTSP
jgi:hypothetical protein